MSIMGQSSTSPATNNAIRGAEQSDNIVKQWFARTRWVKKKEAWFNNMGGMISKW